MKHCRCFGDHDQQSHCLNGPNSTCVAEGKCYVKIESKCKGGVEEHELRMGCLPSHTNDHINQCHSMINYTNQFHFTHGINFNCCDPNIDGTLCNDELYAQSAIPPCKNNSTEIGLAKMIGLSISITAIISICMCIIYKRSKKRRDDTFERTAMTDLNELPLLPTPWDGSGVYTGNSSGRGPPHLHQRTIAKEISNVSLIGHGRFGTVFKASHNVETVAKKVFLPEWEECWKNECKLYLNVNIRDERIVGFKAHYIEHVNGQINRIIVMNYIKHGSLQNFLTNNAIKEKDGIKLISTLTQGIMFLHTEVRGQKQKSSVVHRDISSTSVLVNADGQCCISDFGMAISRPVNKPAEYDVVNRLPTALYASPEHFEAIQFPLHSKPIDFEELMAGDIYSTSLLFWEISDRIDSPVYNLALSPEIKGHFGISSYSQINEAVMVNVHQLGIRPGKPSWSSIYDIMLEAWTKRWQDRLTALRIFQNLQSRFQC